jgi:hypothetical protein
MSSLWHSRIQNTQDIAGATGWYHGNLPSWETLPPIEVTEEEESAKRRNDVKRQRKDLKNTRRR